MNSRTLSVIGLVAGLVLAASLPGAAASAAPALDVGPVGSAITYSCPSPLFSRGSAYVTLSGDYVTVRDTCADGRVVQGRVGMIVDGVQRTWYCTNRTGAGTTVTCDFDWPEGFVGFKTIMFYSAASAGAPPTVLGQLRHWRDG